MTALSTNVKRLGQTTVATLVTPVICMLVYLNLFIATAVSRVLAWGADQSWYPFKPSQKNKPRSTRPRVLVVGAGISGVSAAAACVAAGVEVVIFDKEKSIGGVWARVNKTSSLQFQALFYRFHPCVRFTTAFPHRDEILGELHRVWKLYELESRTRFNTAVEHIRHDPATDTYYVNGNDNEAFDGVITAIGTCGDIQIPPFEGLDKFVNRKAHSSQMDSTHLDLKGKDASANITVLGSGASAVEVVDYVLDQLDGDESRLGPGKHQVSVTVVARSDKWIMPRGVLLNTLSSLIPTRLGYILEYFLRTFWYGSELRGCAPEKPFYASTPCLNTRYLALVRAGRIRYIRGAIQDFSSDSVNVAKIQWDSRTMVGKDAVAPESGTSASIKSDIVFFATGFKKPSFAFCPSDTFKADNDADEFNPPNLFCVAFPPAHPKMLFLNDSLKEAVASAGTMHIGILTRLFLTFVLDPATRPTEKDAADWVRRRRGPELSAEEKKKTLTNRLGSKSMLIGGYDRWSAGLDFYSYGELLFWIASTITTSTKRWKYLLFVMGWNNRRGAKLAHSYEQDRNLPLTTGTVRSVTDNASSSHPASTKPSKKAIVNASHETAQAKNEELRKRQNASKVEVGR
ncbi:hypothetical protein HDU89_002633 [Geranomyces variabilis]|nr:hypothetical protein HDU89_002633 [Geranomyces variabilis]